MKRKNNVPNTKDTTITYKDKINILFHLVFRAKQDTKIDFFRMIYHTRHELVSPLTSHIITNRYC